MADANTPNQADLQANAYQLMMDRTYYPVFFHKLANDYGIVPSNETEANSLVDIAYKRRLQVQAEKAGNNTIKQASEELDAVLQNYYGPLNNSGLDANIRQAVSEVVKDQEVKQAAQIIGAQLAQC